MKSADNLFDKHRPPLCRNDNPTRIREASACMEDVNYRAARKLDRALFQSLQDGVWITKHRSILITGPCGVGKSWLACALGHEACRQGKVTL